MRNTTSTGHRPDERAEQGVCGLLLVGVVVLTRRLQRLAPAAS